MDEPFELHSRSHKRMIPFGIFMVISFLLWVMGGKDLLDVKTLSEDLHALHYYTDNHFVLSAFLFFVGTSLLTMLCYPDCVIAMFFGGYLFGPVLSPLLVALAIAIGSSLFFLLARMAIQVLLVHFPIPGLRDVKIRAQENGFWILMSLRCFPFLPFLGVSIIAATLNLRFKDYFWATFLGMIPSALLYALLGEDLKAMIFEGYLSLDPLMTGVLVGLSGIFFLPILYKITKQNRNVLSNR